MVRLIRTRDIDGLVHLVVKQAPQLAQEVSDKIAFQIQDKQRTGDKDAS